MAAKKKQKKQKKSSKLLKIGLPIAIIIVALIIAANIIISPPPKDLGVEWDEADYESASIKLGRERGEIDSAQTPEQSVKFEGSHPVDTTFTSEELTAITQTRDYAYQPASNVQIKINDDGSAEASGKINIGNIIKFGEAFNIKNEKVKEAVEKAQGMLIKPTFYVKGTPKIVNNQARFEAEEIKIGQFTVTDKIDNSGINDMVNQNIAGVPGLSVEELSVVDGELKFVGTYPDKSSYLPD